MANYSIGADEITVIVPDITTSYLGNGKQINFRSSGVPDWNDNYTGKLLYDIYVGRLYLGDNGWVEIADNTSLYNPTGILQISIDSSSGVLNTNLGNISGSLITQVYSSSGTLRTDLELQDYNASGSIVTELVNASGDIIIQIYSASGTLDTLIDTIQSEWVSGSGTLAGEIYTASGSAVTSADTLLYNASGVLDTLIDTNQAEWVSGSGALVSEIYSASGTAETRLYTVSGALGTGIYNAQTTATDAYNNAQSAQSSANAANGALINKNGTTELTADWNVGSYPIRAYMLSGTYVIGDDIYSSGLIYSSNQIWAGNTVWAMGELWYGAGGIWTQLPAVRHDDAWTSGYAHITNNGTDHSYINQGVLTTSTPQFARLGVGAAAHASGFLYVKGGEYNFPIVIFEDNHSPIRQMGVSSIGLWRRDAGSDTDSAALEINRQGYNDGDTYFRDLSIMDGKGVEILRIDGSAHGVILSAPLYADPHVSGQLWVNGTTVTMSVG